MKVSILISVRNEAKILARLLNSLQQLDFPIKDYEVLFANDESSDETKNILLEFAKTQANVYVFDVKNTNTELKGKTRALAMLAQKALGEYLLFTDADMELPAQWINAILAGFETQKNKKIGVVVGTTTIQANGIFNAMQAVEWLQVLTLTKILDNYKIPTTGLGNNMAVLAEAYWATGGYEKIPFSIIEDYALYMAIII